MNDTPIAVVGRAGCFPAAPDAHALWRLVVERRTAVSTLDAVRCPAPLGQPAAPGQTSSRRACALADLPAEDEGLLPAGLLAQLDPLFRLTVSVGLRAWRDAGAPSVARASVVLANIALPTDAHAQMSRAAAEGRAADSHPLNRFATALPAELLAQAIGLGKGAYSVDAACASSLYAIGLACDALRRGESDVVLTGGVSRPAMHYTQVGFSQLRALSPSAECRPFDQRGDGLVVGEGAGLFVLKRVADAVADGDRIYATIHGIGLSNDRGGSLLSPDSEGQLRAMRAAYAAADWQPSSVDLVECHGTGTPRGDRVELRSLQALHPDAARRPTIGSVKANIGHLLTAAGAAGLMKVLEAFEARQLPPATGTSAETALSDAAGFGLWSSPRPWPAPAEHARRAAISAFGFGGINAHLLVQAWDGGPLAATPPRPRPCAIAIVGAAARFGPLDGIEAFTAAVLDGRPATAPRPAGRWPEGTERPIGAWIDAIEVPLAASRIPPVEIPAVLPQQLLTLAVTESATRHAGAAWSVDPTRRGLVVGIEQALDASSMLSGGPALDSPRVMGALGGIAASRAARALDVGGPAFTSSGEDASGLRAIEVAARLLAAGVADVMVAAAVGVAGDWRAVQADGRRRAFSVGGVARPFDATADGPVVGEGAGAVVLERLEDAERLGHRVLAIVDDCRAGSDWMAVGADSVDAGLLVAAASGDVSADGAESEVLLRRPPGHASTAVTAARAIVGDAGAAGGMASFLMATMALHHAVLPPLAGYTAASDPERWAARGFHMGRAAQHWLHDRDAGPRTAVVHERGVGGTCLAARLRAATVCPHAHAARPAGLFAVPIGRESDFEAWLATQPPVDIESLAVRWHRRHPPEDRRCRGVVARDRETLLGAPREAPAAVDGQLAMVFPGSGSQYVGMGNQLALAFPDVAAALDASTGTLASQSVPSLIRPWRADWRSDWRRDAERKLTDEPQRLIFGHVSHGILVSAVLQRLGVRPDAIIGYSLGESAGLFSSGAWRDRALMFARVIQSPLFTHQLAGECTVAREAWDVPTADWFAAVVNRSAGVVRDALLGTARLLIVNAPGECVLGGRRADVEAVVAALGADAVPLAGVPTVHCELVDAVADAYRALHVQPTAAPAGMRFYSGAWARAYELTADSAADAILANATDGIDFDATIRSAWRDGVRFFVECGPNTSCTRMIGRILGEREHCAVSACRRGMSAFEAVLHGLATLIDAGRRVDLDALYGPGRVFEANERAATGPVVTVVPGAAMPWPKPAPRSLPAEPGEPVARQEPPEGPSRLLAEIAALAQGQLAVAQATAAAHSAYLRNARQWLDLQVEQVARLGEWAAAGPTGASMPSPPAISPAPPTTATPFMDRDACMIFAIGAIGDVLGPRFAPIDAHPTRVRLPDEPLMLVDRIMTVEGESGALRAGSAGRVVTEHDVRPGAWYLDGGRAPVCIAVEAGQADLFLSGWLGIDFETRGERVYRLLDAEVCFYRDLPRAGETVRYDIRISRFVRQGATWLFFFHFEGFIGDEPLISMRDGCAGFFSPAQLAEGRGLLDLDAPPADPRRPGTDPFVPLVAIEPTQLDEAAVDALRTGDLGAAFGPAFAGRTLAPALRLPGGRMKLVHRVTAIEPTGGAYGLGRITAETDVDPTAWYLVCHFVDDRVMPGTLMYEGCLHTLRILLMRLGWVIDESDAPVDLHLSPLPEIASRLRCRGQVIDTSRVLSYRLDLKEIGYDPDAYVLAEAMMYVDGRPVVRFGNVSLRIAGLTRARLEASWAGPTESGPAAPPRRAIYDRASIEAFALGKPSDAFGEPYRPFDGPRRIARLPAPPLCFIDRVVRVDPEPWGLRTGGWVETEYDVPPNAWYFAADHSRRMPFCVVLEAALQPCGWLAAYLGSALRSEQDLHFRNLEGEATWIESIDADVGTLTARVELTEFSEAGGMILQAFTMELWAANRIRYRGWTRFGFFPTASLAQQVGIRDAETRRHHPTSLGESWTLARSGPNRPTDRPTPTDSEGWTLPTDELLMLDRIDRYLPSGGPAGLGYICGSADVRPDAWFFAAHFHQDPVIPGSLGLQSALQLLEILATRRWPELETTHTFEPIALGAPHRWIYRGQVVPTARRVDVESWITAIGDGPEPTLHAHAFLSADGRVIYEMQDFTLRLRRRGAS